MNNLIEAKKCIKCKNVKEMSEFYNTKNTCKDCYKVSVNTKQFSEIKKILDASNTRAEALEHKVNQLEETLKEYESILEIIAGKLNLFDNEEV